MLMKCMERKAVMAPIKHRTLVGVKRRHGSSGYKVKLCEKADEKYMCPLCSKLMRNPVQTYRGILACASCYEHAKSENGICPVDGEEIDSDEVFVDKAKKREIMVLDCYCMYQDEGCLWTGKVQNVEDHEEHCAYSPQTCRFCNNDVTTSTYATKHLNECEQWLANKTCLYAGCSYQPLDVRDLEAHLEREVLSHAILHTSAMERLENDNSSQKQYLVEKCTKMEDSVEDLKRQIQLLVTYTTDLQNKYDSTTTLLEDRIHQLETSNTRQMTDISATQRGCSTTTVQDVADTVTTVQLRLQDLNLRQQIFENSSFDGRLLWKIDNVTERFEKAKNGSVTALHSAPVLTSRYGYKFCARLYLNGDGIGKFTHASLFIVMMRGEYDDVLQWPFEKEIKFRLINLKKIDDDIVESFRSGANSMSFIQPKKEMNVASGCPLFVKQEKLFNGGFVKDDTIFIEVSAS